MRTPKSRIFLSQVAEEQRKPLHRRPQDLLLILILLLTAAFTFFRGMVRAGGGFGGVLEGIRGVLGELGLVLEGFGVILEGLEELGIPGRISG